MLRRHFSLSLRDLFKKTPSPETIKKEKLVIIGSGWAGFKLLKHLDKSKHDITLISPKNYFTFTPLLASTSVGTLEFRSAIENVRQFPSVTYLEANATSIDLQNKKVKVHNCLTNQSSEVEYEQLVIGCGATVQTFNIKGVKEYAHFLKDISHARQIRQKLLSLFEKANQPNTTEAEKRQLLHFAVVGAGPTGVEFCAELMDFIRDDVSRRYPLLTPYLSVSLYDVSNRILPMFDPSLSEYTLNKFKERGVKVELGNAVKEVKEKTFFLGDGREIPYGLLLWSTGLAPTPLLSQLQLPKDKMQRLLTNEYLEVLDKNHEPVQGVYAIGDCARIQDQDLPPTAQVAKQKAQYLAKRLNSQTLLEDGFKYRHKGKMAYVGDWHAIVEWEKQKSTGLVGWMIWRGAYMAMADSLRNKIKIPIYWILTSLTGREFSRF